MATRIWRESIQKPGTFSRSYQTAAICTDTKTKTIRPRRGFAMALFGKQPFRFVFALFFIVLACADLSAQAADFAPYGKASTALDAYPAMVLHGPELRAFSREHYETYQPVVDRMAELARDGVEFRMCNDALRAAGYKPDDMHGFVTVIASGFPEIALLQQQGFRYINPVPLSVDDLRRHHPAD